MFLKPGCNQISPSGMIKLDPTWFFFLFISLHPYSLKFYVVVLETKLSNVNVSFKFHTRFIMVHHMTPTLATPTQKEWLMCITGMYFVDDLVHSLKCNVFLCMWSVLLFIIDIFTGGTLSRLGAATPLSFLPTCLVLMTTLTSRTDTYYRA